MTDPHESPGLQRHFGLVHAVALNISMMVGSGVFVMIPLMLRETPGPYALLAWLLAGALMIVDGMIWSELGAMLPGSGGSYLYLLESFGRWGRFMAFMFVWQFLISGPLEVASGLITMAQISTGLHPEFAEFNEHWTFTAPVPGTRLAMSVSPTRLLAFSCGLLIIVLLYRRLALLGRFTVAVWLGVLAVIGWILIDGFLHFDPKVAFDFSGRAEGWPKDPVTGATGMGAAMMSAMYAYLGYYSICYLGDEVRAPGRTIPRAIMISAVLICVLFIGLHLAMLGTVSWKSVPTLDKELDDYSLAARFMTELHGQWAAQLVTVCLVWSCFGSTYAGMLGYSRIPYGAARQGHFFSILARVHPEHRIPHVSLILVGSLTLFWTFFDLASVIDALIATRILGQFVAQVVGVMLLRRSQPERPRPYRIWLYPLPCFLALVGWLFIYCTSGPLFISIGLITLATGATVYWLWSPNQRIGTATPIPTPMGNGAGGGP